MATRTSPYNRRTRLALGKARKCLKRSSQIPAGVRSTLAIQAPGLLDRLVGVRGMLITGNGYVKPKPRQPGPASAAEGWDELAAVA